MNTLCTGKFNERNDITTTHYLSLLTLWTVTCTFSYCSNRHCYWDRIHLCFFCDAPVLILPQGVETKTWTYTCFWESGIWWTRRCRWKLCYDRFTKCEPLEYTNACALYIPVTPYSAFQWKNNVELLFGLWFNAMFVCRVLQLHRLQLSQYQSPQLLAKINQHLWQAIMWCLINHLHQADCMLYLVPLIPQRTREQPTHHRSLW